MAVRRRSNWYIYFIAFGIALVFALAAIFAFRWYLFPEDSDPVGLDKTGELTDDFRPTAEHNFIMLTMLSDKESDSPDLYILVEYEAVSSRLTFIPIPVGISMKSEGRTLPNVYAAQGAKKVTQVVSDELGVPCNAYVKMDREGFSEIVSAFGSLTFEVPKTLIITDGSDVETINAGEQKLGDITMFRMMMFADYEEGNSYRYNVIGSMLSEFINQNFRKLESRVLDMFYRMLTEKTDTDITEEFYKEHKAALLNSVEYASSPAEYYIPYGEMSDDGGFVISENSITTIKQKAGLA